MAYSHKAHRCSRWLSVSEYWLFDLFLRRHSHGPSLRVCSNLMGNQADAGRLSALSTASGGGGVMKGRWSSLLSRLEQDPGEQS
jgi:hypothetical protein